LADTKLVLAATSMTLARRIRSSLGTAALS
jgi:hypothetical protein